MRAGSTVLTTWALVQMGGWEGRRGKQEREEEREQERESLENSIAIKYNGVSQPV